MTTNFSDLFSSENSDDNDYSLTNNIHLQNEENDSLESNSTDYEEEKWIQFSLSNAELIEKFSKSECLDDSESKNPKNESCKMKERIIVNSKSNKENEASITVIENQEKTTWDSISMQLLLNKYKEMNREWNSKFWNSMANYMQANGYKFNSIEVKNKFFELYNDYKNVKNINSISVDDIYYSPYYDIFDQMFTNNLNIEPDNVCLFLNSNSEIKNSQVTPSCSHSESNETKSSTSNNVKRNILSEKSMQKDDLEYFSIERSKVNSTVNKFREDAFLEYLRERDDKFLKIIEDQNNKFMSEVANFTSILKNITNN